MDLLNILNVRLPSLGEVISSAERGILSEATQSFSEIFQTLPPQTFPEFFRNPLEPLEAYLDRIRPAKSTPLKMNAGAPFVLFLGLSALVHGLLAWAGYSLSESRSAENQSERRREDLLDQARELLEKRKSDPRFRPDLSRFLIATETLGANGLTDEEAELRIQELGGRFERFRERLAINADPLGKLYFLASQLYYDFFHHYARDYPNLKNFLEQQRGNCVAQSKMFLAAYSQSGISLPKNYGLGLQVFARHVQPVLYYQAPDGKIQWVQNLISGKKKTELIAPIYDPAIVLSGFLKNEGKSTPMEFEDLLIARPAGQGESLGFNGEEGDYIESQPIAWPNSEVPFDGELPEDGILEPPVFEQDKVEPGISQAFLPPGQADRYEYRLLSEAPPELRRDWLDFRVEVQTIPPPPGGDPDDTKIRKVVTYFRTPGQRDYFSTLSEPEEKRAFLFKLIQGSLRRLEKTARFQDLEHIFKNPLKNFPEDEGSAAQVREFLQNEGHFTNFWHGLNLLDLPRNYIHSLTREQEEEIFAGLPRWQALHRNILAFRGFIPEHPKATLLMINQIKTSEARYAFFQSLELLRDYFGTVDQTLFDHLSEWITDPKKVGLAWKANQQTPFLPPPNPEDLIEMETLGAASTPLGPEKTAESPLTEMPGPAPEADALIRISPQTMIDLLFQFPRVQLTEEEVAKQGYPDNPYWERWDQGLSQALLVMEPKGFFDNRDYLRQIVHHWVIKGLEKMDPQNAEAWRIFNMGTQWPPHLTYPYPKFKEIMDSPRFKSYLPGHLIPVVDRAEQLARPGVNVFQAEALEGEP